MIEGIATSGIASIDELNKQFEAKRIERIFSNVYKIKLSENADVLSVVEEYEADPNVEFAEPNGLVHAFFVPNDPDYGKQWAHQVIQSEYAWNTTTGNSSVLVAVVDTGIDYDHPDIAANYDDSGYDWVNDDEYPMDDEGHGTHCAGIIAAVFNNSIGVAGLAQVQIMAEKVLDRWGAGSWEDIASGIVHAADQGAKIISLSLGDYYNSSALYEAVKNASDRGILLVAAAGNDARNAKPYPAAYEEVVAVAATNIYDDPAWFSNFGDWIELAAPGNDIYSTVWNNGYMNMSGTSMAAPHVAGVAALIWSQFPSMTRDWIRSRLQNSTDDLGDTGFDKYYGWGRVNARWAVEPQRNHDLRLWGLQTKRVLKNGSLETINCSVRNDGEMNESNMSVQLLANGSIVDSDTISFLASQEWTAVNFSWTPTDQGLYNVTAYVVPVGGENFTENNAMSAHVLIRAEEVVRVPQDYPSIGMAISAAPSEYTVEVASGTYYENVGIGVTKSLALVGEDCNDTIIDGGGNLYCMAISGASVNTTGFSLKNAEFGVAVVSSNHSSVMGYMILNTEVGVYLKNSNHNYIGNNTVSSNIDGAMGIWLGNSSYNSVSNNTVSCFGSYGDGILLDGSSNNSINGNMLLNNARSICIGFWPEFFPLPSNDNLFHHNNFNSTGMYIKGSVNQWDNGYPSGGNYWSDHTDVDQYSGPYQNETGGDGIWDHPYNASSNDQDNYPLVRPWGSIRNVDTGLSYLTIQKAIDANETLNGHTIEVDAGTYYENVLVDKSLTFIGENQSTTIVDGNGAGITVNIWADNVSVSGFTIRNGTMGIQVYYADYVSISGNTVVNNTNYGIQLRTSHDASVTGNTISNNSRGIRTYYANRANVTENTISDNGYGIHIWQGGSNTFYHNNLVNNTIRQVYCFVSSNTWNASYPSGGNYWSDYTGVDEYSGPNQDQPGSDGIGDTPYVINAQNIDNYPLMDLWP